VALTGPVRRPNRRSVRRSWSPLAMLAVLAAVTSSLPAVAQNDPNTADTTTTTNAPTTVATTTVATTAPTPVAAEPTAAAAVAPPADTPVGYVTLALDFIDRFAYRRTAVDMAAVRTRAIERAAGVATVPETYPIITGVLREINDKHSAFTKPPEASNLLSGRSTGFGFTAAWPSRTVIALATDGPAQRAGLRLNDRIDRVDGKPAEGAGGVVIVRRNKDGSVPSKVVLTITRQTPASASARRRTQSLRLTIEAGQPTLVSAPRAVVAPGRTLANRVGYLDLQGVVTDEAGQLAWAQSVHDAIRTIDEIPRCGWVLDLRKNRGGYIYPMLASIGPLAGTGMLAGKRDASGAIDRWTYADGRLSVNDKVQSAVANPYRLRADDLPVAVLTSNLTASAAEAVTISFIGRANARSFGQDTMGLTTFTVMRAMPDNALLSVTNAVDIDRAGTPYDGPIAPDETVAFDWNTVGTDRDAALNAALQWLSTKSSCVANP
jgi:carboxyl-terminal processing protease